MDALRDDRTKTGNPNPNSGQIRPHDPTNPADMARLRGALDIVLGPVMGRAVVGTERADGSGGARQSAAVTQVCVYNLLWCQLWVWQLWGHDAFLSRALDCVWTWT